MSAQVSCWVGTEPQTSLGQKFFVGMPGMPGMPTWEIGKIIRAQASLVRAVSVHPNLRYPGHANFYSMPLTTLNSLSLPL